MLKRKLSARCLGLTFVLGGALAFPGCGGGSNGCVGPTCPPPATPTPTPAPVRNVILQDSVTGLPSFFLVRVPFTTPSSGTLEVTADWTFVSSRMGFYIVRGTCSLDQFNARSCDFVSRSEAATTPKPRVLTVSGLASGSYQFLIGNFSDVTESISFQIVLTTGPGASASSTPTSVSSEPPGGPPLRGSMDRR